MNPLKTLGLCALTALQLGCAQALTPHDPRAHGELEDPRINYLRGTMPAQGTQITTAIGQTAQLTLIDAVRRNPLPIYQYRGEYWVAGTPGQRYELQLTSRIQDRRVLATTSVDGINVISGQTAATVGRGYVLSPNQSSSVQGWRKSEYEVAAFNFAAPQASYAAQTGRPANVGVIGVALFPEALPPPPRPVSAPISGRFEPLTTKDPLGNKSESNADRPRATGSAVGAGAVAFDEKSKKDANLPAKPAASPSAEARSNDNARLTTPSDPAPSVAQGLGTQHGQRVNSYAPTVAFARESNSPSELITLRYDTAENLVARGVLQWVHSYPPALPVAPVPSPFPAQGGFVPDPPRVR